MATIKLKFRPSTVQGKAGTLCYQLCHRQENRQITTDMRIFPEWWNETKRELVAVPGNERVLTAYRKRAEKEMRDIREIIRELDCSGETYTLSEILNRYRSLPSEPGFLYYMKKEMETLWENGDCVLDFPFGYCNSSVHHGRFCTVVRLERVDIQRAFGAHRRLSVCYRDFGAAQFLFRYRRRC